MRPALVVLGVLSTLFAGACATQDSPPEGDRYLSPLDGQTAWDPEQPLVVLAEDKAIPPDYPLPDIIRVVDLQTGGIVPGLIEQGPDFLRFTPSSPFRSGRRYAWTVDVPDPLPHGPDLFLPEPLREPAVFDTSDRIDALAVTREDDRRLCVVLSRMVRGTDEGAWSINVSGLAIPVTVLRLLPQGAWAAELEFPIGDPGVDVVCFDAPRPPAGAIPDDDDDDGAPSNDDDPQELWPQVGQTVRLTWGDRNSWVLPVQAGPVVDAVIDLRRGVRP